MDHRSLSGGVAVAPRTTHGGRNVAGSRISLRWARTGLRTAAEGLNADQERARGGEHLRPCRRSRSFAKQRAGERSWSSGLSPWNHACVILRPSLSFSNSATCKATRQRCWTSLPGVRVPSAHSRTALVSATPPISACPRSQPRPHRGRAAARRGDRRLGRRRVTATLNYSTNDARTAAMSLTSSNVPAATATTRS